MDDDELLNSQFHPARWFTVMLIAAILAMPFASATPQPQPQPQRNEVAWSAELATTVSGQAEYRLPDGSRVDILTDHEAIEVEWSDKWPESIGQSVYYGIATDRQPCVWLLLRGDHDEDFLRCLMVCRKLNINLRTTVAH
jgi:hypothetical protein